MDKVIADNIKADARKHKIMRALFIISFTALPIISFLVFYVYVNLNSFIMAFQKPIDGVIEFVGFENFEWVIERIINGSTIPSDDLRLAFGNTFKTFGINMIMYPIGLGISYFIYKKIWGYKVFRILFYLPSIVSSVVVSFFFKELMSPSGFFPGLLEELYDLDYELYNPLVDSTFANKMIFLHMIWLGFPGNLIIWGGTFSRIPDSIIESARMDGVGWVRELFQIILPLVWPTFVLTITTAFAGMFGATGAVFLLTYGEYGTQTISNWMYMRVQQSTNPLATPLYRVSAMGFMLTAVSCIVAFTVKKFLTDRMEDVQY